MTREFNIQKNRTTSKQTLVPQVALKYTTKDTLELETNKSRTYQMDTAKSAIGTVGGKSTSAFDSAFDQSAFH